jgi:hypothetical protein
VDINEVHADGLELVYKQNTGLSGANPYEPRLVEAAMIQWKGVNHRASCTRCAELKGRFPECRTLSNWQDGACGCCVEKGRAKQCSRSRTYQKEAAMAKKDADGDKKQDYRTRSGRETLAPISYSN